MDLRSKRYIKSTDLNIILSKGYLKKDIERRQKLCYFRSNRLKYLTEQTNFFQAAHIFPI